MENLPYWSMQPDQLFGGLHSSVNGLSQSDAQEILKRSGSSQIRSRQQITPLHLFFNQLKSQFVLIFATIDSALLQDWADAIILRLIIMFAVAVFLPAGAGENAQIKFSADFAHLLAFPLGWFSSLLFTKGQS